MSYTLSIATAAGRDLVVEALRAAADQRTRVARLAARQVADAKAAGTDVRSRSVKVTAVLAEAGDLAALADKLADVTNPVVLVTPGAAPAVAPVEGDATATRATLPDGPTVTVLGDDGTSLEAQALAELAGLTPYDPDAVEDPLTGATPEDEPTAIVEALA